MPYAEYLATLALMGGAWDGTACTFDSNRVSVLAWCYRHATFRPAIVEER